MKLAMSSFPDKKHRRSFFWKGQIPMVHTVVKCFTCFKAPNKIWIAILFSTKQDRNYNFDFAVATLLQITKGPVPSS